MALTQEQIEKAVERYEREHDRYMKLAEVVYQRCQEILSRTSVRATVQRRAKDPPSLRKKLQTMMADPAKADRFNTEDDVFACLSDLAGVRVATYLESDRERIVTEIVQEFAGPGGASAPHVDVKDGQSKSPHYRATHCQVRIPDEELPDGAGNLKGASCEVQVCSLLAHVWNEIDHDLHYKPASGDLGPTEVDLLEQLAQLTRAGDISIRQLLTATDKRLEERTGPFVDVHDFVARLRNVLPGTAASFGDNAGQLLDELQRLGLDTPEKVREALLRGANPETRGKGILEQLQQHLNDAGDKTIVNPASSDLLLVLLLEARFAEIMAAHPLGRGKGRPSRLISLARRFKEMQEKAATAEQPTQHQAAAATPAEEAQAQASSS